MTAFVDLRHTVTVTRDQTHPPTRGVSSVVVADTVTSERTLITTSLRRLRRETGANLVFTGRIARDRVTLDRFDGPVKGPLRGALLTGGRGLGGRVAAQTRPIATSDYVAARGITHDYDEIIRAENLRAMAAAPVVVAHRPIAVLYVALRSGQQEMGRLLDAVTREARALEQEIAVADALRRRSDASVESNANRVAAAHQRLRDLAARVQDPRFRDELTATADLLRPAHTAPFSAALTPRETEVITLVATGLGNQAVADRLDIGLYTVKGHLKSVFAKFDASNRVEAVETARRLGIVV